MDFFGTRIEYIFNGSVSLSMDYSMSDVSQSNTALNVGDGKW